MTTFEVFGIRLLIALLNSAAWALMLTQFIGPLHSDLIATGVAGATGLCLLLFALLGNSDA